MSWAALPDLSVTAWLWLGFAGLLVGFAKTAIGGVASIAVVVFAAVLPARESTGALLPLLLVGDVMALWVYRRHASWPTLVRLVPGVLPGLALGALFVGLVDDTTMRVSIGLILLGLIAVQLVERWRPRETNTRRDREDRIDHRPSPGLALLTGGLAGFATMTANAAGPVMTLYLILAGLPMLAMLGTGAWFFLAVNLAKVPFSTGLGLISVESLAMDLLLVPTLLAGGAVGVWAIRRIDQRQFEVSALGLSAVAAALLLIS